MFVLTHDLLYLSCHSAHVTPVQPTCHNLRTQTESRRRIGVRECHAGKRTEPSTGCVVLHVRCHSGAGSSMLHCTPAGFV